MICHEKMQYVMKSHDMSQKDMKYHDMSWNVKCFNIKHWKIFSKNWKNNNKWVIPAEGSAWKEKKAIPINSVAKNPIKNAGLSQNQRDWC